MQILEQVKEVLGHVPDAGELNNAGYVLLNHERLDRAMTLFKAAIKENPDFPQPWNNFGIALFKMGRIERALHMYRQAQEIGADWEHFGNYLFSQHYIEEDNNKILALTREFVRRHVAPLYITRTKPYRRAEKRVRIGFVSGDFRSHSCSFFLRPIFRQYDRTKYEYYIYNTLNVKDDVSAEFCTLCDEWRDIFGMGTDEAAALIEKDAIDILIDVAGYTVGNRCDIFARKPAPVQIGFLGYPNTTGIKTIDYRLVDRITDPIDIVSHEELIRLPNFLCYSGPGKKGEIIPDVTKLPFYENGFVTFASFNCLPKITPKVVKIWGEIMRKVPKSRMIIKARELQDVKAQDVLKFRFAQQGITGDRLKLLGWLPYKLRLQLYCWVDVCLDTFPYNGVTTTCDGLFMGVPTITRKGKSHVARVGASVLSSCGMDDWIAENEQDYIAKAVNINIAKLSFVRSQLREKVQNSRLMDEKYYTRMLEMTFERILHERGR